MDAQDVDGRIIHAAIWSQFMLPNGGNAMSWWWYDLIHPRNLYYHFAALTRFAKGLDRRASSWSLQTGKLTPAEGPRVNVMGLMSPDHCLLWLYDTTVLPWSDEPLSSSKGFQPTRCRQVR